MDKRLRYELLYALAARSGREKALFGTCAPGAREAFDRSSPGRAFPEIWFEIPLSGEPRFDFHALTSRQDLDPEQAFTPEETGGFPEVFRWFAGRGNEVRQLALSWDLKPDEAPSPAVQLLVRRKDPETMSAFLRACGREDGAARYLTFDARIPAEWRPCYTGIFPGRPGSAVRVECIPEKRMQPVYAKVPELLGRHLAQAGFRDFGDTILPRCAVLADTPFQLEFQFDVDEGGCAGPVFSASLRFACPMGKENRSAFDPAGEAGRLMKTVAGWGLTDDRWRLLGDLSFVRKMTVEEDSAVLYCFPAFIKLRWRAGEPADAKAYLLAGEVPGRREQA